MKPREGAFRFCVVHIRKDLEIIRRRAQTCEGSIPRDFQLMSMNGWVGDRAYPIS